MASLKAHPPIKPGTLDPYLPPKWMTAQEALTCRLAHVAEPDSIIAIVNQMVSRSARPHFGLPSHPSITSRERELPVSSNLVDS